MLETETLIQDEALDNAAGQSGDSGTAQTKATVLKVKV